MNHQTTLTNKGQEFLHYAKEGVFRLENLINDLLLYCKIIHNDHPSDYINCQDSLDEVLTDLNAVIKQNNALITFDMLPKIQMHRIHMKTIFQNLIANGIKFCDKDQPKIHLSAKNKNNTWVFSVQDNGIGIDSKNFKKIFLIFQRLHSAETYSGTGVGLALCKKIVESTGGEIWVESNLGQGSIFYFRFS